VYTVYDQYWLDPETRERRQNLLRTAIFFLPVSSGETDIVSFSYMLESPWGRYGLNALVGVLTDAFVRMEVAFDVRLLGRLADKRVDLRGRKLGRFDKPLGLARKRIASIYRGEGSLGV
jgi:vanillate O-demethylase monooxygenase subunit